MYRLDHLMCDRKSNVQREVRIIKSLYAVDYLLREFEILHNSVLTQLRAVQTWVKTGTATCDYVSITG